MCIFSNKQYLILSYIYSNIKGYPQRMRLQSVSLLFLETLNLCVALPNP